MGGVGWCEMGLERSLMPQSFNPIQTTVIDYQSHCNLPGVQCDAWFGFEHVCVVGRPVGHLAGVGVRAGSSAAVSATESAVAGPGPVRGVGVVDVPPVLREGRGEVGMVGVM